MKRLLVVEDEDVILKALRRLLERNRYEVHTATTVEEALQAEPQSFDLILADLRLPGAEGTTIIPAADAVPVVIMTSHASVRSAVEAMRHGAIDYIAKPFDHDELLMVIERALMQNLLQAQNQALKIDLQRNLTQLQSTRQNQWLDSLDTINNSQRFLHLHGEQGSQREALARAIHLNSNRQEAPFVVAEIGADSYQQDAIHLLGNSQSEPAEGLPPGGLLQAAQNGTMVLRHPEFLEPGKQRQLSEVLNLGIMKQPDSVHHRAINVRVITIGREPVETLVRNRTLIPELAELFTHDQIAINPLREHPEDILPLAYAHLHTLAHRHGRKKWKITHEAEAALRANEWPGNVTELHHVLARSVFVARGNTLTLDNLGIGMSATNGRDLNLDEYFRYFVLRNQGALSETELAARLGISRKALWERRQKMNLPKDTNDNLSSRRS